MTRPMVMLLAACCLWTKSAQAGIGELPTPAGPASLAPNLHVAADGRVLLSWIERAGEGRHALRFAVLEDGGWSAPQMIAEGPGWFVNWADFPSLVALDDGSLAAHWLVKSGSGTYAYDVQIARSGDGGLTWSRPASPHRDGTMTEHGFVSLVARPGGALEAAWLDGRETSPGDGSHEHGGGAMTLRYAAIGPDGTPDREALLDPRVCDCCQTDAAVTPDGPLVVYRDRSEGEVRDIAVVRRRDGRWTAPRHVAQDGWQIEGCPVNGPAVAATGRRVAIAWFTAADDRPRVRLAFSTDSGESFGPPVAVDDGRPVGRVDAILLDDGSAVVSWVEATPDGLSLRLRRIGADGSRGAAVAVLPAGAPLSNGFPRIVRAGERLVIAWTGDGVRTAVMPLPR
jgi:hypothetical protein